MKMGNYDALIDKFYAGTATVEEISLLKSGGLIDEQDALYADALNKERAVKIKWEFEELMNQLPSAKVVALPVRKIGLRRMIAAAAVIVAIVNGYIFWPQQPTKENVRAKVINKRVDSNRERIAKTVFPAEETKVSALVAEITKTRSKGNSYYTVPGSKQSRVSKSIKPLAKGNMETKTGFQGYQVIIDGKPVTNEEDAVAVTRESLGMVSRNLTAMADGLKPIGLIKIKL